MFVIFIFGALLLFDNNLVYCQSNNEYGDSQGNAGFNQNQMGGVQPSGYWFGNQWIPSTGEDLQHPLNRQYENEAGKIKRKLYYLFIK